MNVEKDNVARINKVIGKYFKDNPSMNTIPAKDLMLYFIDAKIFTKDHSKGLPIRKILRELDDNNALHLIPSVRPERKKKNTYWFFDNLITNEI